MEEIEVLQQIDKYIKGQLSEEEINQLWIRFLEKPDWMEYLIIEVALRSLLEPSQ